jgi:hypothetical protein
MVLILPFKRHTKEMKEVENGGIQFPTKWFLGKDVVIKKRLGSYFTVLIELIWVKNALWKFI